MRTWRLPADVDTDQLAPGHTMKHGLDVTAKHCLDGRGNVCTDYSQWTQAWTNIKG